MRQGLYQYKSCTAKSCVKVMQTQFQALVIDASKWINLHIYLSWSQPYINKNIIHRYSHQAYLTALNDLYQIQEIEGIYILRSNDWYQKIVVDQLSNLGTEDERPEMIEMVNRIVAFCVIMYNKRARVTERMYRNSACWRYALKQYGFGKKAIDTVMNIVAGITGELGPPISQAYTAQSEEYNVYSHDVADLDYRI